MLMSREAVRALSLSDPACERSARRSPPDEPLQGVRSRMVLVRMGHDNRASNEP
jgi:hypothetical protein